MTVNRERDRQTDREMNLLHSIRKREVEVEFQLVLELDRLCCIRTHIVIYSLQL